MITADDPRRVEAVIERVLDHVGAELTSDPDRIGATISADAFFPVLVRGRRGVDFMVLSDARAIHDYYAARVTTFEILDSNRVFEQRSEWYALHETVSMVRHVGDFNGIPGAGGCFRVHSTVLFPTDADGIVGELEWTHFDFADIFAGSVPPPVAPSGPEAYLPLDRVAVAGRHGRLMGALAQADVEGVLAEVTPSCHWGLRFAATGAAQPPLVQASGHGELRRYLDGPGRALAEREFVLLNRYASEWFVFAEYALHDRRRGEVIRMVSLLPVAADGRFLAHLGYAVAAGPASP